MKKLILYTTEACHLCELALEQIEQSEYYEKCVVTQIDIASDIELLRQFATRVPVLAATSGQKLLYWPFDHHDVSQCIKNL